VRVCSCLCCATHTDSPFRPYGLSVLATVRSIHRVFQRVLHLIRERFGFALEMFDRRSVFK
jgi:hypothetical protein